MCVCMHKWMNACVCVCVYVCYPYLLANTITRIFAEAFLKRALSVSFSLSLSLYVCVRTCVFVHASLCVCVHARACVCACVCCRIFWQKLSFRNIWNIVFKEFRKLMPPNWRRPPHSLNDIITANISWWSWEYGTIQFLEFTLFYAIYSLLSVWTLLSLSLYIYIYI